MRRTYVAAAILASLALPASDAVAARPALAPAPAATASPARGPLPRPSVARPSATRPADPVGRPTVGAPTIAPTGRVAGLAGGARRAPARLHADSLVVEKGLRRLTLWMGGLPIRTYDVALGGSPTGHKERAGDRRTPEGLYFIDARNPNSRFRRGLHVSYPNARDLERARRLGVDPGGDIMVHGLPNGQGAAGMLHRTDDWTNGCVAVTDEEIDEIFEAVPVGTPIRILP